MPLSERDTAELAAGLPLSIDLEPYRERLTPLATAILGGESRRAVDRRRELVLPDAWDGRLHKEVLSAIGRLRGELTRKLAVLEEAGRDLEQPRSSRMARAVIDRVMEDLLHAHDANLAVLEELERELEAVPDNERIWRAAIVARGAYVAARIHPNEVRRAVVRAARSLNRPAGGEDAAERTARIVARTLATSERRAAVHDWVAQFAEGSEEVLPIIASALRELLAECTAAPPEDDLLWVQACVGLSFEFGLGMS